MTRGTRGTVVRPPRLYGIADGDALGCNVSGCNVLSCSAETAGRRMASAVRAMADGGVGWIQIRLKQAPDDVLHAVVEASVQALQGMDTVLWVNDRPDIAALFPGVAVHVGQDDLPPAAARRAVGPDRLIGLSCHDIEQIRRADADPDVDVVAFGPIYTTTSKRNPDPTVGLEGLRQARAATTKPLVAIGGIDPGNGRSVFDAGADSVVMLGALCRGDVAANSRRAKAALEDPE